MTTTDHRTAADIADSYPLSLEELRAAEQRRKDKHSRSTVTELPPAYAAKLNAMPPAQAAAPTTSSEIIEQYARRFKPAQAAAPIHLSYATAAELFHAHLTAQIANQNRPLEVDQFNKAIIQNLVRYAIQSTDCEYDLSRGIYLMGPTGSGKSMLMAAMQYVADAARLPTRFRIAKTALIAKTIKDAAYADEATARRLTADVNSLYHGCWCFDDLGEDNEPISLKLWGNDTPVMSPILSHRYDLFTKEDIKTHATSNLQLTSPDPDETTIETRYGTRIKDRFKPMFNFIKLDGPSRRR